MARKQLVQPCNKNHAIEETVFVIKFVSPFSQDHFKKISSLKDRPEIKETFPRSRETVGPLLNIKFDQNRPPVIETGTKQNTAGIFFERFKPNGLPEKIITAEGDRLTFNCFEYSRWSKVWPEARRFLETAALFISNLKVATIALNVKDKFLFKGTPEDFEPNYLFKKDSPFLTPNIFQLKELWHCNHGYFEKIDDPKVEKKLLVTNTSIETSGSNELHAKINCFFEGRLEPPGISVQELFTEEKLIDKLMNDLHQINKNVLLDIINAEMAKRINLKVMQ